MRYIHFYHQGKFGLASPKLATDEDEGPSSSLKFVCLAVRFGVLCVATGADLAFLSIKKMSSRFDGEGMRLQDAARGEFVDGRAPLGERILAIGLSSSEKYLCVMFENSVQVYEFSSLFYAKVDGKVPSSKIAVETSSSEKVLFGWSKCIGRDILLVSDSNQLHIIHTDKECKITSKSLEYEVHSMDWSPHAEFKEAVIFGTSKGFVCVPNIEGNLASLQEIPLHEDEDRDIRSLCHVNWFAEGHLCVAYVECIEGDIMPSVALCKVDMGMPQAQVYLVKDLEDEVCSGDAELASPVYTSCWVDESRCLLICSSVSSDIRVVRVDFAQDCENEFVIEGDDSERISLFHDGGGDEGPFRVA